MVTYYRPVPDTRKHYKTRDSIYLPCKDFERWAQELKDIQIRILFMLYESDFTLNKAQIKDKTELSEKEIKKHLQVLIKKEFIKEE